MGNNQNRQANMPATTQAGAVADNEYIAYKNRITTSVMNRIASLEKAGGIVVPKNYSVGNQINLAMLKLSTMTDRDGNLVLPNVTPQSVANALLNMCILGLSLEKGQCAFIKYKNELQFQVEYHGTVALAKRLGGADDPQAQVIYEDDIFEYSINPMTGKKEIIKHEQKLSNISNSKIVGAWCIVPYAGHPEKAPKVEIMTMEEIKQAWMQGATKGQSPAHRNFAQEMVKKTVIGRACKLFISTSDDAGLYDAAEREDGVDDQTLTAEVKANSQDAIFDGLPAAAPSAAAVRSASEPGDMPEAEPVEVRIPDAVTDQAIDIEMEADFFKA